MMLNKKILEAPIVGWHNGERLDTRYRAILFTEDRADAFKDEPILAIEAESKSNPGAWGRTPGSWYLSSLLGLDGFASSRGPIGDRIAIDYGQGWFVTGMVAALREAVGLPREGE